MVEKVLLVENNGGGQQATPALLVDPDKLSVLASPVARRILVALGKKPQCPLDVAKELGVHEQNVYYHFRRLRAAGLVKEVKQEKRQAMFAHIHQLVAPALAAKLAEGNGETMEVSGVMDPAVAEFFEPFVEKGKLNALVIMGDTYSHGQYDMYATEGVHAFDLGVLLGRALSAPTYPIHRFD
ncbi:MAG TPA: winged helix-turn-helix domain-containing protein, partial [archaeon]|nr:winged helix-turn-helix domain-containing protein [archaeon]